MKGKGFLGIFVIVLLVVAVIAYRGGQNLGEWKTSTESSERAD
jgi:hypothetical protein